jgi:hypothetical protein
MYGCNDVKHKEPSDIELFINESLTWPDTCEQNEKLVVNQSVVIISNRD